MKRVYRLRRPAQFHRVRREGRALEGQLLTLRTVPNRRRRSRCGFVVGKHIGSAVVRNRAKRRVREAVRLVYQSLAPGWDVVFTIRSPHVATVEFAALQTTVQMLLQRAGVWAVPTNSPQ